MSDETALDRLEAATKGKSAKARSFEAPDLTSEDPDAVNVHTGYDLCRVIAGDVVEVADSIPMERRDQKVKDLRLGSKRNKSDAVVFLQAPCLMHLIGAAKAHGTVGG